MTTKATRGTRYSLQSLSSHASDSTPSLLVTFEHARYLFNAPESFTRLCVQSRLPLSKVRNVFLGSMMGEDSAGLPGLILSSAEGGNKRLDILGPEGTAHFVATCRSFTRREQLSLSISTPPSTTSAPSAVATSSAPTATLPVPCHSDENLIIYAFTATSSDSPSPHASTAAHSSLKRRRSSTPPGRRLASRAAPASAETTTSISLPSTSSALSSSAPRSPAGDDVENIAIVPVLDTGSANFDPSVLVGSQAIEWRNLVLGDMFRGGIKPASHMTVSTPAPLPALTSASSPSSPPAAAQPPRRYAQSQTPSYYPSPLPALPSTPNTAISYLVIGPCLRGEFLEAEARKRGVKPGPNFAKLVRGEKVWVPIFENDAAVLPQSPPLAVGTDKEYDKDQLGIEGETKKDKSRREQEKGRAKAATKLIARERAKREAAVVDGEGPGHWVLSEECVGQGEEGSAFLVLNIPTPSHLSSLSASLPPALLIDLPSASLTTIYYHLGPSVLSSPLLSTWISSLPLQLASVEHRFSSADLVLKGADPIHFAPAALLSLRLSELSKDIFQLPNYSFLPTESTEADLTLLGFAQGLFGARAEERVAIIRPLDRTYLGAKKVASFSSLSTSSAAELTTATKKKGKGSKGSTLDSASASSTSLSASNGTLLSSRHFNFHVPSPAASFEASILKSAERPESVQAAAAKTWAEYLVLSKRIREEVECDERERSVASGSGNGGASREHNEVLGGRIRVTPLGTGSAVPSKYRNVSSTLIHLPPSPPTFSSRSGDSNTYDGTRYILLDAGEGTWGQLARRFGTKSTKAGEEVDTEETAESVLRGLKCIFISHMHQDHHMGLATILRKRSELLPLPSDPLTIIAPPGIRQYLLEQQQLFNVGVGVGGGEVRFVESYPIEFGKSLSSRHIAHPILEELCQLLSVKSIATVPVLHRCRCWGIVIEHEEGWKIVFSGDTMPCEALVRAGQNATLLIHEATIEDDLPEVAAAKGHSTFEQAIDIARRMKATHCLLTHFSARYPKLPPLSTPSHLVSSNTFDDDNMSANDGSAAIAEPIVAIAFDMATLRIDEFWKMERYREAMMKLFEDGEGDADGECDIDGLAGSAVVGGEGGGEGME